MKTFHWGVQSTFPHLKVFILGIWLTILGIACVVISVIGIIRMAWGYYVSTGMWGGVAITITGLATMYMARVRTSLSAKMYLALSVLDIPISFAMLVLSAGGLTYKSSFYAPVRFDPETHQVTLMLHGSVLSISVVSLACNILSVIVCLKFITFEKGRHVESFKLRRHRHRFSDPNGVYRTGSLHGASGSGSAVRASTSSRTPLVNSDRSQRHSRQSSYSDAGSFRASGVSRRDSDRSRASSRSRRSHHRQSSSASQQSRFESLHSRQSSYHGGGDSVHSTLTRENGRAQLGVHLGPNGGTESFLHPLHLARGLHGGSGDRQLIQPVFISDEEPLPPYEEYDTNTGFSSNTGDDSDVENSDRSSSHGFDTSSTSSILVGTRHLPLNIPVTETLATPSRERPHDVRSGVTAETQRTNSHRFGRPSHLLPATTIQRRPAVNAASSCAANRGSPEICALTGERETPSTLRGSPSPDESSSTLHPSSAPSSTPRSVTDGAASQVSPLNRSSDSSDTSLPERERNAASVRSNDGTANARSASAEPPSSSARPLSEPQPSGSSPGRRVTDGTSDAQTHRPHHHQKQAGPSVQPAFSDGEASGSGVTTPKTSKNSATPLSLGSPNSAFRPVGRTVPVSQISPSDSAPSDKLFSPISVPASGASSALDSSSESLNQASALSWKMIPLPSSHNHSNRASSVPTKELSSKNIPVHEFHSPNVYGRSSDSKSLLGRHRGLDASSAGDIVSGLVSPRYRNLLPPSSQNQSMSSAMQSLPVSTQGAQNVSRSVPKTTQAQSASASAHGASLLQSAQAQSSSLSAQGASPLQFSTLPHRRGQSSDQHQPSRRSFHAAETENSQRVASRDSRQRHTVEIPSSVRTQPLMGVSASGLSSRGRADGSERRDRPMMISSRSSGGQSQSFNPPRLSRGATLRENDGTDPTNAGSVSSSSRSVRNPLSVHAPARHEPSSSGGAHQRSAQQQQNHLSQQRQRAQNQQEQSQRQGRQQQQPPPAQAAQQPAQVQQAQGVQQAQQQQQQQRQQAGENKPLFALLL